MNVVAVLALALMGSKAHLKPLDIPQKNPAAPPEHAQAQVIPPVDVEHIICSLNAFDMAVPTILQTLSAKTKTNLVLLAPSTAKLTVRLDNVPLIDMIRHICAMSGLKYLKVGTTFVFATEETLKAGYPAEWNKIAADEAAAKDAAAKAEAARQEALKPPVPPQIVDPVLTEIYRLSNVNGTQVADALKKVMGEDKLTVVAGPAPLSPTIAEQNTSAATGATSNSLKNEVQTDAGAKTLLLKGTRTYIDEGIRLIKLLDVARPQVSIAVAIYDISNDAVKDLGLNWTFGDVSIGESSPNGINFGSFARTPLAFNAKIQALETAQKAKILAAPNISVLDGERAFILIGDRLNFPVLVGYTANNAPIFDKQQERVGIYLQVAANVAADNSVTLSLYPQVSTVTGFLQINGASYPQISTREAQTTLRLHNGETFVMGGLLKDEEIKLIERVPLLSSIPFLGELFKHRKTTKNSSQVIISITPIVLPTNNK